MNYLPFRHIGSAFLKRAPIQMTFFLTRRCNARCSFCFYLSRQNRPENDQPELSTDEIRKISASIGDLVWLAFSGGEIFLRHDLVEVSRIFYEQNRPSIILFPTNGLQPALIRNKIEEVLQSCPKSTIVVKLSLDGPAALHDEIRGVRGCFEKTMETHALLGELLDEYDNFDLGINSVFCLANQDRMAELIDLVSGMDKVNTHTVSLIRGEALDHRQKDVDLDKYKETINKLEHNLKKRFSSYYRFRGARLKAAQDILQRRLIHQTALSKRRLIPCYAGRLNLVLTESGDMFPCESFADSMKMGNVRDSAYDIRSILQTEQAGKVLASIRDQGCYCTHECYFITNILFNPALYPALLKEFAQL